MRFTVGRLLDQHRLAVGRLDGAHSHAEPSLLRAGDVEGCVAVALVALNTCAGAPAFADAASETPTRGGYAFDTVNWFQEDRIGEPNLRDP